MKQFKLIILTSIITAVFLLIASSWVLEFEYAFLGILSWFLIFLKMYIFSHFVYYVPAPFQGLPFRELWDKDYLMMGVVFVFVSFMGGLIGIVLKGFYNLYKTKLDKIIIFAGPLAVLFSSLAIYKIKLGGTIMSAMHGWPYPFWTHQIKDIVDGFTIDKWIFSPGSAYHYVIFNYLVFLVIFCLVYLLIKFLNQKLKTRKINNTLFLFGLLVLLMLSVISFLPVKKSYIQKQIARGGECNRDVDCKIIANRSPFSCAVVTNRQNANRILNLINSYPSTGELQCGGNEKASCIHGKCTVSIDHTSNEAYWDMLKDAIKDCRVESIMQAHSLEVKAVLDNSMVIKAKEPAIDDVFDIVDQYRDKCGEIRMMTE